MTMNEMIKLLAMLAICSLAFARTINEIIGERAELTRFYNVMRDIDFFRNELNSPSGKKYTVFAPNNVAFDNIPSTVRQRYTANSRSSVAKNELDEIMKYHTVIKLENNQWKTYQDVEMLDLAVTSAVGGSTKLFFRTIDGNMFVNGAKLQEGETNLQADNGVIHIIDTFLYKIANERSVLSYIKNNGAAPDYDVRFETFSQLLSAYVEDVSGQGFENAEDVLAYRPHITVFVPSDESLRRLNQQRLSQALRDDVLLKKIVESHVIKDNTYHGNILIDKAVEGETVSAIHEEIVPKYFSNHLEVSNQCAKGRVIHANITVFNGVIHIIDGLLGYVYNDVLGALEEDNTITDFYGLAQGIRSIRDDIEMLPGQSVPHESQMVTVFAPLDDPERGIGAAREIHSGADSQEKVTRMHMLRGRIDVSQMHNGTSINTFRDNYKAYFYRLLEGGIYNTYVEVNNVRAKIVVGDICVLNGIIHKVDHVLGVPTRTIWEEIQNHPYLESLYSAIRRTGMDQRLDNDGQELTFFAPSDHAFELMQEDRQGIKLLDVDNSRNLRNVLNRHLISEEVVIAKQGRSKSYMTEFNDEEITIVRTDSGGYKVQFKDLSVPIVDYDIRMRNGILHIVDGTLYSATPTTSTTTTTPTTTTTTEAHISQPQTTRLMPHTSTAGSTQSTTTFVYLSVLLSIASYQKAFPIR